jgi:hypothetical protein
MSIEGCHIVIVSGIDSERRELEAQLKDAGALPHVAKDRTQALGRIVELYHHKIIPRAFIVDWNLCPIGSDEHRFYELIGQKESSTAYPLVKHVRTLDPTIAILVLARNPGEIKAGAEARYEFLVLPWPTSFPDMVQTLLLDPRMNDMRSATWHRRRTEEFELGRSADDSDEIIVTPPEARGSAV